MAAEVFLGPWAFQQNTVVGVEEADVMVGDEVDVEVVEDV